MSNAATLSVRAGPWQVWRPDGLRIVIELPLIADRELLGELHLRRFDERTGAWQARPVQVPFQMGRVQRALRQPSTVVYWDLRQEDAVPGRLGILERFSPDAPPQPEHTLATLQIADRPIADGPVRVAVAGVYNYPDRPQIDAIAERCGAAPDLVLLLGDRMTMRIGTGGWEHEIPVLWYPESEPDGDSTHMLAPRREFPFGLRVGPLGLLTADDDRLANTVIGRDLSPWQVWCDPRGSWDPGLIDSRGRNELDELRLLLAAVMRRQLPLILAAGHSSSFISEPLSIEIDFDQRFGQLALAQGHISTADLRLAQRRMLETGHGMRRVLVDDEAIDRSLAMRIENELRNLLAEEVRSGENSGIMVQAGGSRYVCVSAAGGGFGQLEEAVAVPVYRRGCYVIDADLERLDLHFVPADASPAGHRRLSFDPVAEGQQRSGWGRLEKAFTAWYEGQTLPEGYTAEDLQWTPTAVIRQHVDTPDTVIALLDRAAAADAPPQLLRRLMALDPQVCGEWVLDHAQAPAAVGRDWFLRYLLRPELYDAREFTQFVQGSADPYCLRALLHHIAHADDETRLVFLHLLLLRLERQCAGELPFDEEPLLQHAVFSEIFLSPLLSPDAGGACLVPALEHSVALSRKPLIRYLAERSREELIAVQIETSTHPAVIDALMRLPELHPTSRVIGAIRLGARRRLQSQVAGRQPWLERDAQRGLVRLMLDDERFTGYRRDELITALRRRPELADMLPLPEE